MAPDVDLCSQQLLGMHYLILRDSLFLCNDGDASFYFLVKRNLNLHIYRQKNIYPRTKFNKPAIASLQDFMVHLGIVDDSFCQSSRYLTIENFPKILVLHYHGGTFVLFRRFWMPRNKEFPRMIFTVHNLSPHRISGNVNVNG